MLKVKDIMSLVSIDINDNREISRFSFNADDVIPNGVFFAIKGERFDGHDFINQAISNGAILIIGSKKITGNFLYIQVDDINSFALGMAKYWRNLFKGKIITITGSVGKTTTKDLMFNLLKQNFSDVYATYKNQNNELGVPLTILNTPLDAKYLILELGARKKGDIYYFSSWLKADIAIITKIGIAHTENMQNEQGIADCKFEIFSNLPESSLIIVCKEDADKFKWKFSHKVIYLGLDAYLSDIKYLNGYTEANLIINDFNALVKIPSYSRAFMHSLLIASVVGHYFSIDLSKLQYFLSHATRSEGRGNIIYSHGCNIINDCYNANPSSTKAAIEDLSLMSSPRGVVLGDMLDLGDDALKWHYMIKDIVLEHDIDVIIVVGDMYKCVFKDIDRVYDNVDINSILDIIKKHNLASLLFKGSNGMNLSKFLSVFEKENEK